MSIGKILSALEYTLLQRSGMAVTPEQFGLKVSSSSSPFGKLLQATSGGSNTLSQAPVPPVPPEDPSDASAQKKYNEALLAYNQRMFSLMAYQVNQLQQLQRQMLTHQNQTSTQNNSSASSSGNFNDASYTGIGSIL